MYSVIKLYIDDFQHSKIKQSPHYFSPRVGKFCSDLLLRRSVGVSPGQIRWALQTFHSPKERKVSFSLYFGYVPNEVADLLFEIGIFIEWTTFHDELNHHGGWINERSINSLPRRVMDDLFKALSASLLGNSSLLKDDAPKWRYYIVWLPVPKFMKFPWKLEWTCHIGIKQHFNLWLKLMDLIIWHCGIVAPKKHIIDASQPMLFFLEAKGVVPFASILPYKSLPSDHLLSFGCLIPASSTKKWCVCVFQSEGFGACHLTLAIQTLKGLFRCFGLSKLADFLRPLVPKSHSS